VLLLLGSNEQPRTYKQTSKYTTTDMNTLENIGKPLQKVRENQKTQELDLPGINDQ
jgi:hypothetical protein